MIGRYYITTKEIANNEYIYGTLLMDGEKPIRYNCGQMKGNILEVNENLTKQFMEQNHENKEMISILFKYDSLDVAKHMVYSFDHDSHYVEYSRKTHIGLDSAPSIFLSDLNNLRPLKKRMTSYEIALKNNIRNDNTK